MTSYCLPLRKVGETKSIFSCPCGEGFKCVLDDSFHIHSLINIHKGSICKTA
jgi:hypothetical protein